MQVEHREFILVRAKGCPTSSEIGSLYCLAPKGSCSRGVQAGCERGAKSQVSAWCDGQSADCCSACELTWSVVIMCCVDEWTCLGCEPWLPFYSLKGRRAFTCLIGDFPCWVVKPQSRPCRSSPIPSLRHG